MSQAAHTRRVSAPPLAATRKRIVAILPRGEAIRNFVYTGALARLAESADVTALSVKPNEAIWGLLAGGSFDAQPLDDYPERWLVGALRELLDMAHGRRLWSEAARERWRLRDYEARQGTGRPKRWLKKALALPFANHPGLRLLSAAERAASHALRSTDAYLDYFRRLRPDLVFNGSHVHSGNAIQAVQAAQWLKIPTAAFLFSWDNLTSQGRILPAYDYYLVWNEHIRDQVLEIYPEVRRSQVFVTGTPQFDCHFQPRFLWSREEFCKRVGADPRRPIVLYSTGMANHMPGEPLVVERIADRLKNMSATEPPQLLVRVYPKDNTGRFDDLRRRRPDILMPRIPWEPNWQTPTPEDAWLLGNTCRHVAAGINIASTLSLELCMFDIPVINVGYDPPGMDIAPISFARYYEFDHYRPVVESGAVQVARSEDELERMLAAALEAPAALAGRRRALMRRMFGDTLDGRSAHRVADTLLRLSEQPC